MLYPELVHLVEMLPEPALLATGEGEVLLANAGAATLAGRPAPELRGTALADLLAEPRGRVSEFLRLCARSRQFVPGALAWAGAVPGGQATQARWDGAVLHPRAASAPAVIFLRCRPKAEATDRFVLLNQKIEALSKEVIERRKAERERDELLRSERAARLESERNGRIKDEFLATLSHELRTPLNAILGWAQLLRREGDAPPTVADGLDVIERNARAQKQLVDDLLDMSRIITGTVRLDVQVVDLPAVIAAAADAVRPAADARQIRLQVTLDPRAGPVKGDPARLQQVLWNLLSNAVKFTPKEGRVQVFLERVNSHVEVTVSDNGEGIRPEFLPHVFDRFRQADASTTRRHGGLGLGLSIARNLVELHGGTIRAHSPGEGRGATFVFTLPLLAGRVPDDAGTAGGGDGRAAGGPPGREHPADEAPPRGPLGADDLAGVTVLAVDDEPDARVLVRRLLEGCGASVLTAASAEEALGLAAERRPDVLISDVGMPDVDGYALLRRLRALPAERGGRTPAIALTAFARSEDRTRALLAGYNIHLAKPVEPVELVITVRSLVGRTGGG